MSAAGPEWNPGQRLGRSCLKQLTDGEQHVGVKRQIGIVLVDIKGTHRFALCGRQFGQGMCDQTIAMRAEPVGIFLIELLVIFDGGQGRLVAADNLQHPLRINRGGQQLMKPLGLIQMQLRNRCDPPVFSNI